MRAPFLVVAIILGIAMLTMELGNAAASKVLQRLKGTVGYQLGDAGAFSNVAAKLDLPDDAFAITRDKSAALLQLPDSSLVSLGMNTRVQVGAFDASAAGPGDTITVNGGALRFEIKRPQGGIANYRFVTPTAQVAVRGTIGLLAVLGGQTTVTCLVCAADSITVTAGGQTITLAAGQTITISASGALATGATTSSTLSIYANAGVSTSASTGIAGATAGIVGHGLLTPSVATGVGAAAAAGIVTDVIVNSSRATPVPAGTVQGTVNLQEHAATPAPASQRRTR